ncbi:DNA ligase D [Phytoactinopolyspora halotolerans]|uniref:DNA ligase (ATP) n=1 Tax=Phytoactinopolyspora halotolerans TaxID=1981512 RepID=A0A6L9S3H3_9ACTN|nr:DNA ligase D [Phytoactinopolyspora halotolerans]NED99974.1 DNA ligase D [Phytoactinopolyspora halotolerans]
MAGSEKLREYRKKRSFDQTPEPQGDDAAEPAGNRFVIQEHHARRLHWDLRLEHDGVLVSWALPRGLPDDPKHNRLAVHTEDHPLEYLTFEGDIPAGEYGGGSMTVWDTGTYEAEKFRDDEVIMRLHGKRATGKFALFQTGHGDDAKNWLIHRMDPPEAGRDPMPDNIEPMLATLSELPPDQEGWGFEVKWDGVRALAYGEVGKLRLVNRNGRDITGQYPEIGPLMRQLGSHRVILDGELVAFDEGRPSFERLQPRINLAEAKVRQRQREIPVTYIIFDLLYLDGRSLLPLSYEERRRELEALELDGKSWSVPGYHREDGAALLAATRERGIEGVIAKRLDSRYQPGRRSRDWLKVKNVYRQEAVIGGWTSGQGQRQGDLGALLVGYYEDQDDGDGPKLRYAGKVGTGFDAKTLRMLRERLDPLRRKDSPFTGRQPQTKDTVFVDPELVCEVEFREWTASRTLRQPAYVGLRDDKPAHEVFREETAAPPEATQNPADDAPAGVSADDDRDDGRRREKRGSDDGDGGKRGSSKADRGRDGDDGNGADEMTEGRVQVEGKKLKLSNLGKVFYPETGMTKGDVIAYYHEVAPALLPHLRDRPLTMKRYPDGVDGESFYEKQCPSHRPDWVSTAPIWSESNNREVEYCLVNDLPTLVWVANLADLELHTMLARAEDVERPTFIVFDLDPGEGVGLAGCAKVAVWVRDVLNHVGLKALVKSSGSKGLHLAVPLNTQVTYDETKPFAHAVAQLAEHENPGDVVSRMTKARRKGKVFVDWSQNTAHKTTVAPFSLRARSRPTVSVPLTWDEVEAVAGGDADEDSLRLEAGQVLAQLDDRAKLFRPLLELEQQLPELNV